MAKVPPAARIELPDDLPFTRKSWIAERGGWALLVAVLVAALLGLLGPGLFSKCAAVSSTGMVIVEYDRFGNFEKEESLTVRLTTRPEDQGRASLWIEERFLDNVFIRKIRPRPLEMRSEQDRTTFVFAAPDGTSKVVVRFDLAPEILGRLRGRFGRDGEAGAEVSQFIHP